MSLQGGSDQLTRAQHKNQTAFKNDLHKHNTTNPRTKLNNSIQVSNVCTKCKDIIEWKIKYNKYKPLTQPKTCVRCNRKTVKEAYHVICVDCGRKGGVCTKCCQTKEVIVIPPSPKSQYELDLELKNFFSYMPLKRRRTFLRYREKKQKEIEDEKNNAIEEENTKALLDKLHSLEVEECKDEVKHNDSEDLCHKQ